MALQTALDLNVTALYSNPTPPLGVGTVPVTANKRINLLTGVGANQADKIYTLTNTLAASGTTNLDLAGAITDVYGIIFTIVKLKMLIVRAAAANTNNVVLGPAASNGVTGLFGGTTPTINILPGGIFAWAAPGANTVTITAGTGDLLTFTNSSSGTGVTYDVIVVGTSS